MKHILSTTLKATVLTAVFCMANITQAQTTPRFTYNAAGDEVTDSKTKLVWKRCSEGQRWSGGSCTGTATTYTHEAVLLLVANNVGAWRVPNVKELASIVDRARANPAIDGTAFPNTPIKIYWTSTPDVTEPSFVSAIYFNYGIVGAYNRLRSESVRLVR